MLLALPCLLTTMASAELVIDEAQGLVLDVDYWAGEGEQESFLVVDFGATGGDTWGFGYRWDGDASMLDLMNALMTAGDLEIAMTTHGNWGTFVDNFSYGDDAGEPSQYWAWSTGTVDGSGTVDWTDSAVSIDSAPLVDGSLDGWYNGFNDDFTAIPPLLPLIPIPSPGSLVLLGITLACPGRKRVHGV